MERHGPPRRTHRRPRPPVAAQQRDCLRAAAQRRVTVLTAAARLTRTGFRQDGTATTRPCDWAEFVSLAVAGAAANIGSIESVLAGRPGSWRAGAVRALLSATVGDDEQQLLTHRTEPGVVNINVDDMMVDLGAW